MRNLPCPEYPDSHPPTNPNTMSHQETCCKETCCAASDKLALVFGSLLLRLWLGVRALQTGIEKYAGYKSSDAVVNIDGKANDYGLTAADSEKFYALKNYHGVPQALMGKFEKEPLMPAFGLPLYDKLLGIALLGLGLTILLGIAYRSSLFLLGLLYISLTWGLILIKEDGGVAGLGTHMILLVCALAAWQVSVFHVV
jgi:thiosulfate dehydrogenase [quinone] large subunit